MSIPSAVRTLVELLGERLGRPPADLAGADWPALLDLARTNRVAALAQAALAGRAETPAPTRRELLSLARRSFVETTLTAQALREVAAALAGQAWVLLRGPALGAALYQDLMLRPYGDLDVLVRPEQVDEAARALRSIGFNLAPGSLNARYYRAYHLHLPLARPGPAGRLRLELHWAIDHPFSLYTEDVQGLLARRRETLVEQTAVPVPAPEDLILTLAMHAVKHAVQLPYWVEANQVWRVAPEGSLLALFDIALAAQRHGPELDWKQAAERAGDWGAAAQARACLDALEAFWPGSVPDGARARFPRAALSFWQRAVYGRDAAPGSALFRLRGGAFFRPIRALDALHYVFAPTDYMRRRYGSAGVARRLRHGVTALGRLGAGAAALAYWSAGRGLARLTRAGLKA